MNRVDFVKSISNDDGDNVAHSISKFFDHTMAMYNLIGVHDDIDICAEANDKEITFIILGDNKEETNALYSAIKDSEIPIYGHVYIPELRKKDNSIHVALIEKHVTIKE